MKKIIKNKTFDLERSLYGISDTLIDSCVFAGPADGESVLKECRNICADNCKFSLRYPIWHAKDFTLKNSVLDSLTRAPLWYCSSGEIQNCTIESIKCLRECKNIKILSSHLNSDEFGWRCRDVKIKDSEINSVYFLFESSNVKIENLKMSGKYSFQYTKDLYINNSSLDTKDAFWHGQNITVENSVVKGEYLGWFSKNLTFINCKIIGTQPLCYCKNLKLINCTMVDTDLSFEYSDVRADVRGNIVSVKNPASGIICADSIGEIIHEDSVINCRAKIKIRH